MEEGGEALADFFWSHGMDCTISRMSEERSWDVLIIGGPSGAGKTSTSYPLARRFGIAITEIDDMYEGPLWR